MNVLARSYKNNSINVCFRDSAIRYIARPSRAAAPLNRVRSALTQEVRVVMGTNLSVRAG